MADRRWAGSWLSGTTPREGQEGYPGQRLGLPEHGPRSVAGLGRRLAALFIDWILATLIATGVVSVLAGGRGAPAQGDTILHQTQWWTLFIF
ncbi:MAG: hypothetical protein J2P34_12395, partial [Actinobacteria bacterium]|nr:hypothetical protein [Actinomycetota bacterium]